MSANTEETRTECIKLLTVAKSNPNWKLADVTSVVYKANAFRCTLLKRSRATVPNLTNRNSVSKTRESLWGNMRHTVTNQIGLRVWSRRDFILRGQTLSYYDGATLRGTFTLRPSNRIVMLQPSNADGREFAFAIISDTEE